jgi:hypothetical protein
MSLIGHHDPTAIGVVVTGLAIDLDPHFNLAFVFFLVAVASAVSRAWKIFSRDSLLVGHSVNDQQNLFIHIR